MKNFHRIVLLVLLFLFIGNTKANICIPTANPLILSTQTAVDSFPIYFPDCTDFDGDIIVSGNNIINLNGLSNLKYIRRDFYIENNPALNNLSGLSALIEVNDFRIVNNSLLINLNGLSSLKSVSYFVIRDNARLINMSGLNNLDVVTRFIIQNNVSLNSLHGLDNYTTSNWLSIGSQPLLINMNGLENLKSVTGQLEIYNNRTLTNLDGLNILNQIGSLYIENNPVLKDLTGLSNLRVLDNLVVDNNNALINLIGLQGITKLRFECNIRNNASLLSLDGLNNIDSINNDFQIMANNKLIDLSGLDHLIKIGQLAIIRNELLTKLSGLNEDVKLNGLFLYDNIKLNCCYKAKLILENNPQINFALIFNNDNGCNSETEIRSLVSSTQCCVPHTLTNNKIICVGSSYTVGTHTYTTSGTYTDTIHFAIGCDSIITTNLTVRSKSYQIITKDLCVGQQFTLSNGKIITTSGTYKDTIPNFCDSIIEYHLNFYNNINTTQNAIICKGKSHTLPKGNVVSVAGIYRDTLQASFGCDSIITTNLTVTNPIPFNNNVTICSGKTFIRPNGNIVSTTGIYYDTIKAPNTCDSIVITNLTVTPYFQSTQISSVCRGKSFTLPSGRSVQQSGIFKDTIKNNNGCDSIITTNLTVTNPIPFINAVSICEGKNYTLPNGRIVNTAGTYTDTLKQNNTCDSIVVTNLTIFPNTFNVALPTVDTIDAGSSIELIPIYTNDSATTWLWTPTYNLNCTTCERPIASPFITTTYRVNASANNGCEDSAQTTIVVRNLEVHIPTAFSPNNDGVNDELKVFANNPKYFHLSIFNRWGELVFESTDINHQWNGTYKGNECLMDNYSYVLDVVMQNDIKHYKKGSILLLR